MKNKLELSLNFDFVVHPVSTRHTVVCIVKAPISVGLAIAHTAG